MSISVSNWDTKYSNHDVWQLIESTIEAIDEIELEDEAIKNNVTQMRAVLQLVLDWRETPSLLVGPQMLTELHNAVQNPIKGQLDNWHRTQNINHIHNAFHAIDGVLNATRGWPPTKDRYAKGLITTIQEVERDATFTLETLKREVETVKSETQTQLQAISNAMQLREESANDRLRELNNEVESTQQTLEQIVAKATETDNRVSTVATNQQTAFTAAEAQRQEFHSKALVEQKSAFDSALDDAISQSKTKLDQQESTGISVLERLKDMENEAKNLVEATSDTATTTDYGKYAEAEKNTADRLRISAAITLILGGLLVVGLLLYEGFSGGTTQTWLVKSALSLPFVASAWYLIRESSRHRDEAEMAKDTQLKILALSPFITKLNEADQWELRKAAANELFVSDRRSKLRNQKKDK